MDGNPLVELTGKNVTAACTDGYGGGETSKVTSMAPLSDMHADKLVMSTEKALGDMAVMLTRDAHVGSTKEYDECGVDVTGLSECPVPHE